MPGDRRTTRPRNRHARKETLAHFRDLRDYPIEDDDAGTFGHGPPSSRSFKEVQHDQSHHAAHDRRVPRARDWHPAVLPDG
jgi:hypothetical protein